MKICLLVILLAFFLSAEDLMVINRAEVNDTIEVSIVSLNGKNFKILCTNVLLDNVKNQYRIFGLGKAYIVDANKVSFISNKIKSK